MIKRIRKIGFLSMIILFGVNNLFAAYLENVPQTITQPNGEVINCFATGDEFYHWLHDAAGYTIVLNPDDGYFYYGIREGDEVVPSRYRVNSVNPASVNLPVGAKISARLYQERKNSYSIPFKSFKDAPTTGQVNNLVVYIAFADDSLFSKPRSYYKPFFSHEDSVSLKDYFREVSYNRLFIDTYHYPESPDTISIVYIDEKPRSYFLKRSASNPEGYPESEGQGPREHALLKRAIEYVDAQIPDTLNLDMNDDGRVDNVCFVMQGSPAGWSDLLWPHRWALYGQDARLNGKRVWDYLLMLESGFSVGTLCHEFFHVLGAPDLYHYTDTGAPTACGRWDIMDSNANPPQYMGAFMKYKYGDWIASLPEIKESGTYSLYPLSNPEQNVFKIKSPLSTSEYFVVEYRRREGRYESSAPGTGMVVYRINPGAGNGNAGGPPDEVFIYRPGGTLTTNGNLSAAAFGTGDRREINDKTDPAPFLYKNGQGGPGGLDIFNISDAGDSISFDITITPLYPPNQLVFTLLDEKVALEWQPTYSGGFKNYIVYRNGQRLATVIRPEYEDWTIVKGENYIYTVTAYYEGEYTGESEPSNAVSVTPLGIMQIPYFEDFEKAGHGWLIKGSTDGFRWGDYEILEMSTDNETRFLGANSVAAGKNAHTTDFAVSPRLNLEGLENIVIEFDYALKIWQRYDKLFLHYRKSKTDSWVSFMELPKSGIGSKYIWKHMTVELPQDAYTSEAQIAFQYDDSNEFAFGAAIDNVMIRTNSTSIETISTEIGFSVFPNPSSGKYDLVFEGIEEGRLKVNLYSAAGLKIWSDMLPVSGSGKMELDLSEYPDGIYYLVVGAKSGQVSRKLLKISD